MMLRARAPFALTAFALSAVAALSGCSKKGELVFEEGVGIASVLTLCPAVGIPDYTGDVTTFRDAADTSVASLDVSAAMTNLRATCNDTADQVYSEATFTVNARRTDTRGARTVELPYFVTVLRGGSAVVSKRIGTVTLAFADGQFGHIQPEFLRQGQHDSGRHRAVVVLHLVQIGQRHRQLFRKRLLRQAKAGAHLAQFRACIQLLRRHSCPPVCKANLSLCKAKVKPPIQAPLRAACEQIVSGVCTVQIELMPVHDRLEIAGIDQPRGLGKDLPVMFTPFCSQQR